MQASDATQQQGLGRPEVARKLEERSKTFDVAAMTKDLERSDVELPSDASGVGARGDGFVMGTTRPRARSRRVVAAPLDRGQTGGVDKWSSESAVMAEQAFKFVGSRGPGMVRRAMHVGQVFRNMVLVVQREHDRVDRATELQKRSTMVSVAAQFFWAAKQDSAGDKKGWEEDGLASLRVEEDKETKKRRKKQRKQAELRLKAKWRTVAKAAGQAAQPMERARAMAQARQRRAEQGQLLLQAVDRGAEVVRLRRVLARALYSWGLGHAQDRARCILVNLGARGYDGAV